MSETRTSPLEVGERVRCTMPGWEKPRGTVGELLQFQGGAPAVYVNWDLPKQQKDTTAVYFLPTDLERDGTGL